MKKILFASLAIILSLSCQREPINFNEAIPPNMTFQLNSVDNVFFAKDYGPLITGIYHHKYTIIKANYKYDIEWIKNNYDWGNIISGSGWGSSFYSVQIVKIFQRNDGSFVCIAGITEGGDVIYFSTLVILLSQHGDQIQKYRFDDLYISNALQTDDGGYILFGSKVIKFDRNFIQQWEKEIFYDPYHQIQIVSTSNNGFATTGSYDYNGEQVFLKEYDSKGNELISRIYKLDTSPYEEIGIDLVQLSDKGFLIIGRNNKSFVPNVIECQIIRTNAIGDTIWTKRFGYSTNSWLERLISNNQSEFVLEGSIGFPNENQKSILIKINKEGQILDSASMEKFQFMVYSPLMFYIKVQNQDSAHVNFYSIEADKLFN